jgi:hypothetical protein
VERPTGRRSLASRLVFRWLAVGTASLLVGVTTFAATIWLSRPSTPVGRIVLAEFANRTQETGLDMTLRLALAVRLQREPSFEVVSAAPAEHPPAPAGETAAPDTGRDDTAGVCAIERGAAVIHGSITVFGTRYALGLEATSCRSGSILARELVEARSKDDVLDALTTAADRLSRKLVVTLGDDRRSRATRVALHASPSGGNNATVGQ